jgi:hypothetical protein
VKSSRRVRLQLSEGRLRMSLGVVDVEQELREHCRVGVGCAEYWQV